MQRSAALGLFASLAASSIARPLAAGAQAKTTVRIGEVAVEAFANGLFAKEAGFFDRVGIDAQVQVLNGGGATLAALLGGSLDVAITNAGAMSNAHIRGVPLYLFAPGGFFSSASPTTVLLVAKDSPLRTGKDLNGKTVALSTLRDLVQASTMRWVDQNGGDSSTVKFLEIPTPQMVPALTAARIDAAMVVEPVVTENKDVTRVLAVPYDTIAKKLMISGWVATKDWLDNNKETARKFVAAIRQTSEWAGHNPQQVAEILAKYTKISTDVIAQEKHVAWEPALDPKAIQPVIDASFQYKFLPQRFDAKDLFYRL